MHIKLTGRPPSAPIYINVLRLIHEIVASAHLEALRRHHGEVGLAHGRELCADDQHDFEMLGGDLARCKRPGCGKVVIFD
jgi:hypothetical protein